MNEQYHCYFSKAILTCQNLFESNWKLTEICCFAKTKLQMRLVIIIVTGRYTSSQQLALLCACALGVVMHDVVAPRVSHCFAC